VCNQLRFKSLRKTITFQLIFGTSRRSETGESEFKLILKSKKTFYNDMVPKIQELKGIAKSTQKWDLIVDSKSDQIKIETKRSIRGLQMMKGQGPIDWSP